MYTVAREMSLPKELLYRLPPIIIAYLSTHLFVVLCVIVKPKHDSECSPTARQLASCAFNSRGDVGSLKERMRKKRRSARIYHPKWRPIAGRLGSATSADSFIRVGLGPHC